MTAAQLAALAKGRPMGGTATIPKQPPAACPKCNRSMSGRSWHSYLGHLGLHGLADNRFAGDIEAAQRRLRENGLARQDPVADLNNFWPVYKPVMEASR